LRIFARIAQQLHGRADRLLRHPNRLARRTAQLAILGLMASGLTDRGGGRSGGGLHGPQPRLFNHPSFLAGVRRYLQSPGVLRPWLGSMARRQVLRESVSARRRQLAQSDRLTFVWHVNGRIDQQTLRNLLIWQNHVLESSSAANGGGAVDIILKLPAQAGDEPRLFDLISAALVLARIRNLAIFWGDEGLEAAAPIYMSNAELARWSETRAVDDLRQMPRQVTEQVERSGTRGGVKLLLDGRKRVQDFFKAAMPGQFIVAVGLREGPDGAVDPDELSRWLSFLDTAAARHRRVGFVVLNRVAPSQWRAWPAHVRFARHQGLSMQDALCLAQVADGYAGVVDIFGLTANAAARPGVYVPLTDGDGSLLPRDGSAPASATDQIMLGSRNPAHIEAALERFVSALPRAAIGLLRG
jgi:hypothetical protein